MGCFGCMGLGFRVYWVGFTVLGLGFFGFRVLGSGSRVQGLGFGGFRVHGFRAQDSAF